MSRYQGFSEPIEVLIAILDEQKKQTVLLEQMVQVKQQRGNENEHEHKPKNAVARERSNRSSRNNAK